MNDNVFATDIRIDQAGRTDHLIIIGAGEADDINSVINDDETGWDLVLEVSPSESADPYDDALAAAGFINIGSGMVERR